MLTYIKIFEKLINSFIIAALFIPFVFSHVIYASSAFHANTVGYDISYPQCDKEYPILPSFAVIGVNGGKAFTDNRCFEDQYTWAIKNYANPSVYMNLNYPNLKTISHSFKGPNSCSLTDEACLSYNYGYQAAGYAYSKLAAFPSKYKPKMWWLDVETMNTWSNDTTLNAQVIQGAIDSLKNKEAHIGVYSTNYLWKTIAGNFKPQLPVWAAGAKNKKEAPARCHSSYAFTGGEVYMVQYVVGNFDNNHLCQ